MYIITCWHVFSWRQTKFNHDTVFDSAGSTSSCECNDHILRAEWLCYACTPVLSIMLDSVHAVKAPSVGWFRGADGRWATSAGYQEHGTLAHSSKLRCFCDHQRLACTLKSPRWRVSTMQEVSLCGCKELFIELLIQPFENRSWRCSFFYWNNVLM